MKRKAKRMLAILGYLLLVPVVWAGWVVATWPDVAALATEPPETTAFIERWREVQREAGEDDAVEWAYVAGSDISVHLKRAVVAAEDLEFFQHSGFSTHEMRAAVEEALEGGELRGASTITQQLAKNLWLSPSRNPLRKLKEAVLTRQLEKHVSKQRILTLYLNVVEFGPGVFGAEAAARRYFGKPAAELDEWESALLSAGLPRPTSWNPDSDNERYLTMATLIMMRVERAAGFFQRHLPQ
jgi:monofunctional biosynthetic peptidoglycan transglycosylase